MKILVVDDDPRLRDLVAIAQERADFTVITAANGPLALTHAAQHGATRVDLRVSSPEGRTVPGVSDNGKGVAKGNRDQIFTPFFTTTREPGGTGMGLTIAANLLAAHGAAIALRPGTPGATFALTFGIADWRRLRAPATGRLKFPNISLT